MEKTELYLIGGVVVAVLLMLKGGSGSSDPYAYALKSQQNYGNTAVSLAKIATDEAKARDSFARDVYVEQIKGAVSYENNLTSNNAKVTIADFNRQVAMQNLASAQYIADKRNETAIAIKSMDLQSQADYLSRYFELQNKNADIAAANLPQYYQYQLSNNQLLTQREISLANIQTQAQRTMANASAQSSMISDIGGIASIASDIFGGGGLLDSILAFF